MPLAPANLRLADDEQEPMNLGDLIVEMADEGPQEDRDEKGNLLTIEGPDGSITLTLDGSPLEKAEGSSRAGWFDNLVEEVDEAELSIIAEDLLKGIEDDLQSRKEWIEDRAQGIKLLGLKLEVPGLAGAADGAPVEGMSRIRHPLLLEAVLRFQANARSELLPTDGPVKIREDNNNATLESDQLANDLETISTTISPQLQKSITQIQTVCFSCLVSEALRSRRFTSAPLETAL